MKGTTPKDTPSAPRVHHEHAHTRETTRDHKREHTTSTPRKQPYELQSEHDVSPVQLKAYTGTCEQQLQTSTSLPALGLVHTSDSAIKKQDQ